MLCSQVQKRTRCCSIHPGFRVGGANTIKSHGNSNDKGPSPRPSPNPPALVDGFEKRTKHSVHLRYRETKWTTTPQIVLYCPISKKNIVDKTTTIHPSIQPSIQPTIPDDDPGYKKGFSHQLLSLWPHTPKQERVDFYLFSIRLPVLPASPLCPACLPDLAMQAAGCSDIYNRILGTKQRTRRRIINRNEIYGPGVILWDSNNMSPCLQTQHEAL